MLLARNFKPGFRKTNKKRNVGIILSIHKLEKTGLPIARWFSSKSMAPFHLFLSETGRADYYKRWVKCRWKLWTSKISSKGIFSTFINWLYLYTLPTSSVLEGNQVKYIAQDCKTSQGLLQANCTGYGKQKDGSAP